MKFLSRAATCCVAVCVAGVALSARAQTTPPAPAVTVVVHGDPATERATRAALPHEHDLGVRLEPGDLPRPTTPSGAAVPLPAIADARVAYEAGEFDRCLALVGDTAGDARLLAQGHTAALARVLLYRFACDLAAQHEADADAAVSRLASFGLELPGDVGNLPLDVEQRAVRARAAYDALPRATLRVLVPSLEASVSVDGGDGTCPTPCALSVAPGVHVVRTAALGYVDDVREVRVDPGEASLSVRLAAAPRELAARQWADHFGARGELDDDASLRLLARALGVRRLALVDVRTAAGDARFYGALLVDGHVAARATRLEVPSYGAVRGVLRDLLVGGHVLQREEVWQSPWFWTVVGVGVALVVGAIALTYAALTGPVHTRLLF